MNCHACGADVVEGQKFCQECGESLRGVTDPTARFDPSVVGAEDTGDRPSDSAPTGSDAGGSAVGGSVTGGSAAGSSAAANDVPTGEVATSSESDDSAAGDSADDVPTSEVATSSESDGSAPGDAAPGDSADDVPTGEVAVVVPLEEATLPELADLPTQEIDPREPLPDPTWAAGAAGASGAVAEVRDPADATLADLGSSPAPDPGPDTADDLAAGGGIGAATRPVATEDFLLDEHDTAHDTDEVPVVDATTVLPATPTGTTDEFPAVFDGSGDVHHFPPPREPFKLRLVFVLGFFGAIATLMSSAADVTDIRTSRPVDGISIGIRTLSDIGVNLPIAGFTGGVVMALGGLLACYGFRWGAGLAGGGGLAVAGWAGLAIGLAEVPIAVAESITRTTTTQQFTLTVTRDLGFWLIVSAGAIGLLVFAASLRLAGTGGRRSLNPWVAAVGAVSTVILAAGPLIPVGGATFADNVRSTNALIDLPTAYFGGRLGQVALIGFAGVVGFLLVRAYGLGLVAGGISVGVWLWISSLLEIGEDPLRGDEPLGIAAGNFGSDGTTPHGVTTVGMVLTLLMLLIAAVVAAVQFRRDSARY